MKSVKQAIVIRKDLKLRKEEYASIAASASIKFLLDNNESDRTDELFVRLSQQEVQWLKESLSRSVLGIDSEDALGDLAFKAEMMGINSYSVTIEQSNVETERSPLICVAIGPDDEDLINQLTNHLKPI